MIVLGIETSCDETAAAVVESDRRILADKVRRSSPTTRLMAASCRRSRRARMSTRSTG